jgi:hypothetical protein
MTMENYIDIVRRTLRWNMLQPKFDSSADQIDHQRPLKIAVAISAYDHNGWTHGTQFLQNPFRAQIAQVPDFVRLLRQRFNARRQPIMRVGDNKNSQSTKHQNPNPGETSSFKLHGLVLIWSLMIGASLGLGAWNLELTALRTLTPIVNFNRVI